MSLFNHHSAGRPAGRLGDGLYDGLSGTGFPPKPNPETVRLLDERRRAFEARKGIDPQGPKTFITPPSQSRPENRFEIQPAIHVEEDEDRDGVEPFLRDLMQDSRHWQPGKQDPAYRDGIAKLFRLAWPGQQRYDTSGRAIRDTIPAVTLPTIRAKAREFLPDAPRQTPTKQAGQPEPQEAGTDSNGRGGQRDEPAPAPKTAPRTEQGQQGKTVAPDEPAQTVPGIGHNSRTAPDDDATGPEPFERQEGETFEDYQLRLTKRMAPYDLPPDALESIRNAYTRELEAQDPDWQFHIQGYTKEELKDLEKVTDRNEAAAIRDLWDDHGGMMPIGVGAGLTHVVGPDGTVYRRDWKNPGSVSPQAIRDSQFLSTIQTVQTQTENKLRAEKGGTEAFGKTLADNPELVIGMAGGFGSRGRGSGGSRNTGMPKDFPRESWIGDNPMAKKEFDTLPNDGMVDPTRIRTMQDTVSYRFRDSKTLADTRQDFADGKANAIPPVRIFERDGKVYTLDHRRLVAARLAGKPLRYRKVSPEEVKREWHKKFSSTDDGTRTDIIDETSKARRRRK